MTVLPGSKETLPLRTETRNSVVLVLGTGVTAVLSLVYVVYAGRVLGPADYADFTTAVSLVALFSLALGPINGIVTRFTAQYAARDAYGKIRTLSREITRRIAIYGLVGVAIGVVVVGPLGRLLQFNSPLPLIVTCVLAYLSLLLNVPRGVLRGAQAFGKYNANSVLEAAIRLAAGLFLLHWICGVVSGLSAYLVGLVGVLAFSHFQVRALWRDYPAESVDGSAIKRFSAAMFLAAFVGAGFQNIDMLFVKHYFDPVEAGHYGAAFTLARSIGLLAMPFGLQLLPRITSLYEQGQPIRGPLVRICGCFLVLAAGPILVFGLWDHEIIMLLYGSQYEAAASLLAILAVAWLASYLAALLGIALSAMNDFRFLYIALPTLAVEALALAIWRESLGMTVGVVLAVQGLRLAVMIVFTILARKAPMENPR